VSAVLPGAANRVAAGGLIRRWRARRAARRSPPVRSGSHLGELEEAGLRAVAIAVGVGPLGSPASQNRVTVHDWFSGYGTPPREGNVIEPLIDGEEAWAAVARDLEGASREACISSWLADPDIELVRPEALAITNPDRRARYRLAALVEGLARRGGRASILIWNWFGTPILHPTLRRWAVNEGDGIEVLQHAHPQLLGSFHEKTIVVDRRVAYCGGFNLRQNDWDTQAHRVDDPRRNPHALSGWERRAPEPAFPPRHDLALRIEGPLVADVHQNFTRHWNGTLRRERRALRRALGQIAGALSGSGPATPLDAMPEADEQAGPVLAQFVRTDPRLPKRHQAIVDVTLRAISNARRLIYIENQFFRSKRVAEVIRRAMRRRPRLEVVVVTNQVGGLVTLNPQAYWTHLAQETLRSERPEFTLYELLACGELDGAVAYRAVFLHSKVMVVDDEWATVGSANINDRSIYSEYEANVAIEDGAFAKRLRTRLMAEHLGLPEDDARLADVDGVAELFRQRAAENAEARRHNRLAEGRAHPFYQERSVSWVRGRAEWF
jgi:phosphatidylserine/phosphatidylglycerophosphate/cardiolipin synthase-like enzyme